MASLGGVDCTVQAQPQPDKFTRTRCTGGTAENTIGSVPSVKVHAAPGGSSSISLGADIDTSAAPSQDKSDATALSFLSDTNQKYKTQGKLTVRDFHMIGSFPLFQPTYEELRISSMSYAEKVNASGKLLSALNRLVGEPARPVLSPQSTNATAAPVAMATQCQSPAAEYGRPSRTKCVGGVADN